MFKLYLSKSTNTPQEPQLNEIYYNCTECSSHIQILSIKNNIIEFKCLNKNKSHKKILPIIEYINQMKNFNNKDINNDICLKHNKIYESYCLDCNKNLCNDCLKLREHFNHNKNNIIEAKPNKKELNIFENIINYYDKEIEKLENEKVKLRNHLKDKIGRFKNKLKEKRDIKINDNNNKKEKELKMNKQNFLDEIKKIKENYEKEIKLKKLEFLKKNKIICDKYKIKNEYNDIVYKKDIENLDMQYINIIQKYNLLKRIENLKYRKRLNEIIYYTYDRYNNNYYNAINIFNILRNYYIKNENIKNKKIIEQLNNEFKDIIKLENEKKINKNVEIRLYDNGKYEGEFKGDKREGKGIFKYNNGNIYEGDWKNNNIEGKGIFYSNNGDKYDGEWKANKFEGKGIFYYKSGDKYEGEWKNHKREGRGIYTYKSGSRYEGEYKTDKREGKGIYYWNDGDRYEGDWKKDKKDGKGVFYYKNGDREIGDYFNGRKVGKHVTFKVNGDIISNIYE